MHNKTQIWDNNDLFCHDLPTKPQPKIGKILVIGGTGYIGGRLVPELLARGYQVRLMEKLPSPELKKKWPDVELVEADGLEIDKLGKAMEGIYAAYYLIHSLLLGQQTFAVTDILAAINFTRVAEEKKVKRIIYLSGLADVLASHSCYLKNRMNIAQIFKQSKVPTTILRMSVMIGSGSAAYEVIEHVAKNVPIIFIPLWARIKCQPIGIRDVIKHLVGVLEVAGTSGKSFDIGGNDVLTIEMMMKIMVKILGKKRLFIYSPISNSAIYAYIASFFTPVPSPIIKCLIGGFRYSTTGQNHDIRKFLSFRMLSYKEMILRAMTREEQDRIYTRWSDAYPPAHELAIKLSELEEPPQYTSSYSLQTEKSASSLFHTICNVGGREGWFNSNWLWRLRGWFDRMIMGVGISRGRKSISNLQVNDVIDFWRVEELRHNELLLLRAEMKLPGMGWLEFKIEQEGCQNRLSVKAYYQTNTLFGKIYWYLFLPSHRFIFSDMAKEIEKRS